MAVKEFKVPYFSKIDTYMFQREREREMGGGGMGGVAERLEITTMKLVVRHVFLRTSVEILFKSKEKKADLHCSKKKV